MTTPCIMGRQSGFTMLELLVAFVIMALSLGMLYRASGGGAIAVNNVDRHQQALILAESLLNIRDGVPPSDWSQAGESAGFRWRISTAPFPTIFTRENPSVPILHEIQIAVSWDEGGQLREVKLETLLPEQKPAAQLQ